MANQSKNKILVIIIAVLLLINAAMIIYFFKLPEKAGFHNDLRAAMPEFLQNDIGFNSQQMQQYDSLSEVYNKKFKATMDDLKNSRQKEFKQLANTGFNDSTIDSIASLSTENKKLLEIHLLQYTKDIRKLCTAEQQAKFDTTLYKVLNKK